MNINPNHKYHAVVTVEKELFRSCSLYDWSTYCYLRMVWVIFCELMELVVAVIKRDIHGKHGVYVEAGQVSACCQKMMMEISRRTA